MAKEWSDRAVVTALAPVCADKFRAPPDADAKKVTLSKWQIPHYGHLCTFRCARMLSGFQTYSMSVIVKKFCHQNIYFLSLPTLLSVCLTYQWPHCAYDAQDHARGSERYHTSKGNERDLDRV